MTTKDFYKDQDKHYWEAKKERRIVGVKTEIPKKPTGEALSIRHSHLVKQYDKKNIPKRIYGGGSFFVHT